MIFCFIFKNSYCLIETTDFNCGWGASATAHDTTYFVLLVSWKSHGMGQPHVVMEWDRKQKSANPGNCLKRSANVNLTKKRHYH